MTLTHPTETPKSVVIWLAVMVAMIFVIVILGGVTRLTQSGLSMVDWRPIMGIIPPLSTAEWEEAFAAYKAYPEYQKLNYGMTLAEFQAIFLMEYFHRVWGRLIGIVFILPFLSFLIRGHVRGSFALKLTGLLLLGGAQGVMGWVMVKSGLVDDPSVSQYRLAAHLSLALLLGAILLWMALARGTEPEPLQPARRRRVVGPLHPALALAVLTVLSGAFVAGLDAGQTFNTFPLMDGQWVPDGMLDLKPIWRNPFENVPMVQFDHRVLGILTMLACLLLWWRGQGADLRGPARIALNLIGLMALVQPALGIITLLLVAPVSLAAAHQAGAMILLGLLIWLLHETKRHPGRLDYAPARR
ncbi:MAG: COX15/CtaA family protein [Alphaproteobacteria bacterium]|nr:COX15/CtaA family protein [Alphaproteobacteria bacterium]